MVENRKLQIQVWRTTILKRVSSSSEVASVTSDLLPCEPVAGDYIMILMPSRLLIMIGIRVQERHGLVGRDSARNSNVSEVFIGAISGASLDYVLVPL